MQNNTFIYTIEKVKNYFQKQRIRITDWPPYNPDLNPIENIWHAIKYLAFKIFLENLNDKG